MRYALGIEYDGSGFNGWQSQRDDPSVQECVESAVGQVADHAVSIVCAGRTDTGVHARCQVAHFDSDSVRSGRQWVLGINSQLPVGVSVHWVRQVADEFHARFSAMERRYRYTILNRWVRPAIGAATLTWCRHPLDAGQMNAAAACLLGEHDFSAFRSAGCKARHAVREVTGVSVCRDNDKVILDISANGFLYHMVRNIVGSLLEVGRGDRPVDWISELLAAGDRTRAGVTAAPEGLCFIGVRYPGAFGIPAEPAAFPAFGGGAQADSHAQG
jgi:tRNA pseudouridine38-40 synthase